MRISPSQLMGIVISICIGILLLFIEHTFFVNRELPTRLARLVHTILKLLLKWATPVLAFVGVAATALALASRSLHMTSPPFIESLQSMADVLGFSTTGLVLTMLWYRYRKLAVTLSQLERQVARVVFVENFDTTWENRWDFKGNWHVDSDGVIITQSHHGGITRRGREWGNYTVEFRAQVLSMNMGIIVRAQDLDNYYMLQLTDSYVVPHRREKGKFWALDNLKKPHNIPLNDWHHYSIIASGRAIALSIDDRVVFECNDWLRDPTGKVGFRCWGPEKARIRGVKVTLAPEFEELRPAL